MEKKMTQPFKSQVAAVNRSIRASLKTIRETLGTSKAPMYKDIEVKYDLNSANALGTHRYDFQQSKHIIRLNPALLNELKQPYIDDVLVHEVCHALVKHNYGRINSMGKKIMPHGKEFKYFCRVLNIDTGATTNVASGSKAMKASGRNTKRHTYSCKCSEHQLSTTRHNKIQRGTASYSCRKCNTTLSKGKLKVAA